jgi:hypothetical protein
MPDDGDAKTGPKDSGSIVMLELDGPWTRCWRDVSSSYVHTRADLELGIR